MQIGNAREDKISMKTKIGKVKLQKSAGNDK